MWKLCQLPNDTYLFPPLASSLLWRRLWSLSTTSSWLFLAVLLYIHTVSLLKWPPKSSAGRCLEEWDLHDFYWYPTRWPSVMLPDSTFTSLKNRPHSAVFVPKQCYFAFLMSHRDFSISSVLCVLDTKKKKCWWKCVVKNIEFAVLLLFQCVNIIPWLCFQ